MAARTAMLLDVDGVLADWSDGHWRLRPGAPAVLARMRLAQVPVIAFGQGASWSELDTAQLAEREAALTAALADEEQQLTALHLGLAIDDRWPKPGLILRAAQAQAIDLATSWLISAEPMAMQAAAQAGCLGGVLIGEATPPKAMLGFTCNQAADLADAPRVMVPPQGGCWHDHR